MGISSGHFCNALYNVPSLEEVIFLGSVRWMQQWFSQIASKPTLKIIHLEESVEDFKEWMEDLKLSDHTKSLLRFNNGATWG